MSNIMIKNEVSQEKIKKRSQAGMVFKRLLKDPVSVVCMVVLLLMILSAVFAPLIAPYDYAAQDLLSIRKGPSAEHWLGTDELGRDILSRLIYGARNSLIIGAVTTIVSMLIGVPLGLISGYAGKTADAVIMRACDIVQAIPDMLLAISISAALGIGIRNCIIAMAICRIPAFARMARASALSIAGMEYVEAAKAMDLKKGSILAKHIFPNTLSPLIVQGTMMAANSIIQSAGLSFMGLGVQPPQAEWGAMLATGRQYIRSYPHMLFGPLVAILILVLSLNLLGDGLRDALDPKMKK